MRAIVAVLAILAIGKVYVHYNFYRAAADQAIITAYRVAAIGACQKSQKNMPKDTAHYLWQTPRNIEVAVGQPELDIALWDIEHPRWEERYKRANLILSPSDTRAALTCRFDIETGNASISNA